MELKKARRAVEAPPEDALPRVLIVEDEVDQREALASLLETAGFVVERAVDGPDAVELARRCRPDIILIDLSMPRMDGFEVSQRLGADTATRHIPLIALTARNISPSAVRVRGPFRDVFFKPVQEAAFLAFLWELVKQGSEQG